MARRIVPTMVTQRDRITTTFLSEHRKRMQDAVRKAKQAALRPLSSGVIQRIAEAKTLVQMLAVAGDVLGSEDAAREVAFNALADDMYAAAYLSERNPENREQEYYEFKASSNLPSSVGNRTTAEKLAELAQTYEAGDAPELPEDAKKAAIKVNSDSREWLQAALEYRELIGQRKRTVVEIAPSLVGDPKRRGWGFRLRAQNGLLVVTEVVPGTDAAAKLKAGTIIYDVAGTLLRTVEQASDVLKGMVSSPKMFSIGDRAPARMPRTQLVEYHEAMDGEGRYTPALLSDRKVVLYAAAMRAGLDATEAELARLTAAPDRGAYDAWARDNRYDGKPTMTYEAFRREAETDAKLFESMEARFPGIAARLVMIDRAQRDLMAYKAAEDAKAKADQEKVDRQYEAAAEAAKAYKGVEYSEEQVAKLVRDIAAQVDRVPVSADPTGRRGIVYNNKFVPYREAEAMLKSSLPAIDVAEGENVEDYFADAVKRPDGKYEYDGGVYTAKQLLKMARDEVREGFMEDDEEFVPYEDYEDRDWEFAVKHRIEFYPYAPGLPKLDQLDGMTKDELIDVVEKNDLWFNETFPDQVPPYEEDLDDLKGNMALVKSEGNVYRQLRGVYTGTLLKGNLDVIFKYRKYVLDEAVLKPMAIPGTRLAVIEALELADQDPASPYASDPSQLELSVQDMEDALEDYNNSLAEERERKAAEKAKAAALRELTAKAKAREAEERKVQKQRAEAERLEALAAKAAEKAAKKQRQAEEKKARDEAKQKAQEAKRRAEEEKQQKEGVYYGTNKKFLLSMLSARRAANPSFPKPEVPVKQLSREQLVAILREADEKLGRFDVELAKDLSPPRAAAKRLRSPESGGAAEARRELINAQPPIPFRGSEQALYDEVFYDSDEPLGGLP